MHTAAARYEGGDANDVAAALVGDVLDIKSARFQSIFAALKVDGSVVTWGTYVLSPWGQLHHDAERHQ